MSINYRFSCISLSKYFDCLKKDEREKQKYTTSEVHNCYIKKHYSRHLALG